MASVRLVRHATLLVELAGTRLLVDPMLSETGAMDPIPDSPNDRRNPLRKLPDVELGADALLVTHLHRDHLDDVARGWLNPSLPVYCQPEDGADLEATFRTVIPVGESVTIDGIRLTRTPARHGHGDLAEEMGPVSGFVLEAPEETVYLTGDTVWYEEVARTLEAYDPDAVVVNAGAAQFTSGDPITMTAADVLAVCEHTDGTVIAVHMDAINHCLLTRAELRAAVTEAGYGDRVVVPGDGERVEIE